MLLASPPPAKEDIQYTDQSRHMHLSVINLANVQVLTTFYPHSEMIFFICAIDWEMSFCKKDISSQLVLSLLHR